MYINMKYVLIAEMSIVMSMVNAECLGLFRTQALRHSD